MMRTNMIKLTKILTLNTYTGKVPITATDGRGRAIAYS